MALSAGTRVGPYEILSALGSGGMGDVYRARDTKLGRDVAIKVLPDLSASDPERLGRFQREAQVLASLNHPHVAIIHGLEESNGILALVMELVEGEDLTQRIARGPIPLDQALPIAKQIAEALEAAHEQGIIHRDLKPANIKVRPDGTVKVLDFGLAKMLESGGSGRPGGSSGLENSPTLSIHATQAGIILGTAAYMSPEQAAGKAVDKRSDLWAFGVVVLEMLTGRPVFTGETVSHVIASVLKSDPDWTALPVSTPAPIRRLLRRCLEKDRKRRLDSVADARLEIDEALTAPTGGADMVSVTTARAAWARALPWGIAAALAILAGSLAYQRQSRPVGAVVRFTVGPPFGATRPSLQAFAVSPDGQAIAFQATGADGIGRIFTRRLDQADAQPVAGTDNATGPFWSPDSRSLGFFKEGGLYRTELDGSAPRRLSDVAGGAGDRLSYSAGTWGARGDIVFTSSSAGLSRVPDTGGTPAPVTSLDAANKEVSHASPWFLPDGRHVLFLALGAGQLRGVIWVVSIDNPARTRIVESSGGARYADGWLLTTTGAPRGLVAQRFDPERLRLAGAPQPVRDRLTVADTGGAPGFSVSLNGALAVDRPPPIIHQLTWMDRVGRVVGTIGPAAVIRDFGLAPDERRVAATVTDVASLKSDLWLFDTQREERTRLTFQEDTRRPMWALDGRHIYFTTNPSFELRSLAAGAVETERFENPGGFVHFEDVTRDGRYLVFKSPYSPAPAIWIQRVGVPGERRALVQGQFFATQARVSPDGRWLAYTLGLPSRPEVFVQPFDRAGGRLQASRAGGTGAMWRDDGRELYYEGTDGLMAVATTERAGALDVGAPQKLFSLHTQGFVINQPHNVEVAANGQKFLVNAIVGDSDNVPIEVTLNWSAGLKK